VWPNRHTRPTCVSQLFRNHRLPPIQAALERRVAQTPETVGKLVKAGFTVKVEKGAGLGASFSDSAYEAAGASIVDRDTAFGTSLVRWPLPRQTARLGMR